LGRIQESLVSEADTSRAGFNQAMAEHHDALSRFAMVLTHDKSKAEDLVQETYLRAVRAQDQLRPDSNLTGWLFTIMRNIWLNQLRQARSDGRPLELDAAPEGCLDWLDNVGSDPHAIFVRKIENENVRAAVECLPHHYLEVVTLRHIEGLSYRQIACVLQCPVGTVMSRLGRAHKKLRLQLSD
jgi:RNA polymerase sigma-70 factor, ECF subfamily